MKLELTTQEVTASMIAGIVNHFIDSLVSERGHDEACNINESGAEKLLAALMPSAPNACEFVDGRISDDQGRTCFIFYIWAHKAPVPRIKIEFHDIPKENKNPRCLVSTHPDDTNLQAIEFDPALFSRLS